MNLREFQHSNLRNQWIEEPGLRYYVTKHLGVPGLIILANVYSEEYEYGESNIFLPYWKFMKRYVNEIPFIAQQVLNLNLARYYERTGWKGYTMGYIPQYASPLALKLYKDNQYLFPFGSEEKPSDTLKEFLNESENSASNSVREAK